MIGLSDPIASAALRRWQCAMSRALAMLVGVGLAVLHGATTVRAADSTQLRVSWTHTDRQPRAWRGAIRMEQGRVNALTPLGRAPDEGIALRLAEGAVRIAPGISRDADVVDLDVLGEPGAELVVDLRATDAQPEQPLRLPLAEAARGASRTLTDGTEIRVRRAPTDAIRVASSAKSLVFSPQDKFQVDVSLSAYVPAAGAVLRAAVVPSSGGDPIWQQTFPPPTAHSQAIAVTAPAQEGAYRLRLTVQQDPGLMRRVNPFTHAAPAAVRDVEFVVVDSQAKLPRLADEWTTRSTIDLANPDWPQRLPTWVRTWGMTLSRAAVLDVHGRTSVAEFKGRDLLEFPAIAAGEEPAWIAVELDVARPGAPHAVEIVLPATRSQRLGVCVVERDAGGRLITTAQAGAASTEPLGLADADFLTHRVEFWPSTKRPFLILVNQSEEEPLQVGSVKLLERGERPPEVESADRRPVDARLVAAYYASPNFVDAFGAQRGYDEQESIPIETWQTYLQAASRMAQTVRASGYNGAIVGVAAEGAALAPVNHSGGSTRFDAGRLSSAGADPMPKDVLELLLRVFEREGLTLVPAIELSGPAPTSAGEEPVKAGADLLDPAVQAAVRSHVGEIARRCAGRACYGGVAIQITGRGYGLLPGLETPVDPAVVKRFAANAAKAFPDRPPLTVGSDVQAVLLGPYRAAWTNWRNQQVASFYRGLIADLPAGRDGTKAYICVEDALAGPASQRRLRMALAGHGSLLAATDEAGLDLRALAETPGAILLRPQRLADGVTLAAGSLDAFASGASEIEDALAGTQTVGEMLTFSTASASLPSVRGELGADAGEFSMSAPVVPLGAAVRSALTLALSRRDCKAIVIGGRTWPSGCEPGLVGVAAAIRDLPAPGGDARIERQQPLTMRVSRTADSTAAIIVNDSPWATRAKVSVDARTQCAWRQTGLQGIEQGDATGDAPWSVELPPFGVVVRRWDSPEVRVGVLTLDADSQVKDSLAKRLAEVEARMAGLQIRRAYQALANAGFEAPADGAAIPGWELRVGAKGMIALDQGRQRSGAAALHLVSVDEIGVAVETPSFAAPETGQLAVGAEVRTLNFHPQTKLYAAVEFTVAGEPMRRFDVVLAESTGDGWRTCELDVDDLPLDRSAVRVQFQLVGPGEAWIDDVALYDLQFSNAQRIELAKRVYAAKIALEEGKVADCRRMLQSYWPSYLLANVPVASPTPDARMTAERIAARPNPADASPKTPAEAPPVDRRRRLTEKLKGMTPRLWR